jgi:hypothetical protein
LIRALVAAALAATVLVAGCGPTPAATPEVQSPVDGIVTSVDVVSLTDVRGFTLQPLGGGGLVVAFKLGPLENATAFSPSHLKEHQATSEPIRVWFRIENGERVAYRLEDAPATPAAT